MTRDAKAAEISELHRRLLSCQTHISYLERFDQIDLYRHVDIGIMIGGMSGGRFDISEEAAARLRAHVIAVLRSEISMINDRFQALIR